MKKLSFLFFITTSILMLLAILNGRVTTDIFSLIKPSKAYLQNQQTIQNIQQKSNKTLMFLSTQKELLYSINQNIFTSISLQKDFDLNLINQLKLASFNQKSYESLTKNAESFFQASLNAFLNPFLMRVDSKDLLNLSSHSSFLEQNTMQLDLESKILFTLFEGQKYYFATAILKDNYDSKALLDEIATLRQKATLNNLDFLVTGNAVFASSAKEQGNKESLILGTISLILITLLMYFSFHSWQILKLLLVVAYSLLCGISVAFLIFGEIHIISLVVSISLIGLVLDFAMHWLGDSINTTIEVKSIRKFTKIFLAGLIITSGGYGFFLLSKMEFLHQIAIISIFGLLGAFLITTFLLPFLFENLTLRPNTNLQTSLEYLMNTLEYLQKYQRTLIFTLSAFIAILFFFLLPKQDFNDKIQDYSNLPKPLLNETRKFLEITNNTHFNHFIILKSNELIQNERQITNALLQKQLITDYEGISKFFLTPQEQETLKQTLLSNQNTITHLFVKVGIQKEPIHSYMQSIQAQPILNLDSINEILQNSPNNPLETFLLDDNTSILFVKNPINNAEFKAILKQNGAYFIEQSAEISQYFTEAKKDSIFLKLLAFAFAFVLLWIFFGFKRALPMVSVIIFSFLLTLALLLAFGITLNIFSLFGLILATSVGVDYVIFANNTAIAKQKRFFGIILANLTSVLSFSLLAFSETYAISSFGISVSLCMFLCAFFALFLLTK